MASRKSALITGITGQDGACLAAFLLQKGYDVHGLRQWSAVDDTANIRRLVQDSPRFHLHFGDLAHTGSLVRVIEAARPDEIYHLAAMTHVGISFDVPELAADINATGTLRLLEAIRQTGFIPTCRFYQASTSELFGNAPAPQNESTPFAPVSPYASAKLAAYWYVRNYRDAWGLHASNGILFNHESPTRPDHFVTRKITRGVADIAAGRADHIALGNLESRRDWGHARDYVAGMWLMLQQDAPDDYVLATGISHSVRTCAETAFACVGISLRWEGSGVKERGIDTRTGVVRVRVDPALFRPHDVHVLLGDPRKAQQKLGWRPQISFGELIAEMVQEDCAASGVDLRRVPHNHHASAPLRIAS